ncbi:MAG: FAD-dependent oxidoreductase [Clostridia bacterium]|nr:FAD-dependent oxidoreductase [Clostridia bacterium]
MVINEYLETKVVNKCDVLVCGGGFAGISAALASARQGKKTILLEKEYILGGLGTAGIVTIYLPLCDGFGHQVSYGICEELFRLSISMGAEARYPENWLDSDDVSKRTAKDKRFEVQYNPSLFAMLVEQLLLDAGVEILYGTYAVSVSKDNDKIKAVIVENKSGRRAIAVSSVVDATGDADIVKFADAPFAVFGKGNVLAAWYYRYGKEGYKLQTLGFCDISDEEKKAGKSVATLVDRRFSGLDGKEISEQTILSHASTLSDIKKRRVADPTVIPTMIATIPQLRMTRRIDGDYVLDESEAHKYFEDSVGMVSDWRKRGPVFEVPFRTLFSSKVKNLICAGRCTSVTDDMWDIMRVIPCCAVTGEAAGVAAAMTDDFSEINVKALQEKLVKNGVKIHLNEIGL